MDALLRIHSEDFTWDIATTAMKRSATTLLNAGRELDDMKEAYRRVANVLELPMPSEFHLTATALAFSALRLVTADDQVVCSRSKRYSGSTTSTKRTGQIGRIKLPNYLGSMRISCRHGRSTSKIIIKIKINIKIMGRVPLSCNNKCRTRRRCTFKDQDQDRRRVPLNRS